MIVRIAAGDPVSSPLPSVATGMAGPSMGCQDKDEGEARKEGEEKESERERAFTAPVRGEPPPKRGEAGVDPPLLFCPRGFAPFPFPPHPVFHHNLFEYISGLKKKMSPTQTC